MEILTNIVLPLLLALIPTGGVVALFTLREKKTELMLENSAKVQEAWEKVAEAEARRVSTLNAEMEKKDDKITEKDVIIENLHKEKSEILAKLDSANTDCAIAKLLICDKTGCQKRRPPFGKSRDYNFHSPCPVIPESDESEE